ncbi:MAG: NAD(P)/FAD-dependent oxidoreductase [Actinobacteria bacterium]|jgi:geranylgeranyl reductase family protein|nr:NAD(P)/FAD-dependent oxidoreductase [Actinomycetota bacterium]MBT3746340.1 NAD(P)/FAD-dependent oxidoreductase [Actinomycetota bacterium]MBT3970414.1 NAD(P)/FAD-dependent oxidoreductase [Actinomycetota bacterium]MBT4009849.1 NAD(P)/FAD-dependent oxidoreductase [Actinomycetota bacterium]MBT4303828.1 NAD(P)/FAD-dependent oxidoreductase [Actinomycetota bacterium]
MQVDVAIVGGGPAGSAAAITLAQAGRSVLLIDKAISPRDKCCGDGLTALALRLSEQLGLDPATLSNWQTVDRAILHWADDRTANCPLPQNSGQFAAAVPRSEYDHALLNLAKRAGATVKEGHSLTALSLDNNGAVLTVDGLDPIAARSVIAADGMWSATRRLLDLGEKNYRGDSHGFRQYVSQVGPAARDLHIWFEPDLLPGYAWSFPLPNQRANVGFGILRGGRVSVGDSGRLWEQLMDRPSIRSVLGDQAIPEDRRTAWPIPARITTAVLSHGPVLFVGDAAKATDALTGEGIGQALLTGILAAESIVAHQERSEIALAYQNTVRQHLAADHRMSIALQRLITSPMATRNLLGLVGSTAWTRRNFARWMFEDYPRALLGTPRRWRPGAFSAPGAYRS